MNMRNVGLFEVLVKWWFRPNVRGYDQLLALVKQGGGRQVPFGIEWKKGPPALE